jgi:hypothetical protein
MSTSTQAAPAMRRRGSGSALEQGIVFGVILGVIQVLFYLLNRSITAVEWALPVSIIGLVIAVLMYLFAGIQAAHHTGRVGSGAFAGIWTGIISSLMSLILSFLLGLTSPVILQQQVQAAVATTAGRINQAPLATGDQLLLNFITNSGLINLICVITLGLIIGSIGGLIGAPRANQPYHEKTYQAATTNPTPNNI